MKGLLLGAGPGQSRGSIGGQNSQADIGLLFESGTTQATASVSLVCLALTDADGRSPDTVVPGMAARARKVIGTSGDPLESISEDGKSATTSRVGERRSRPTSRANRRPTPQKAGTEENDDFFDDSWYFVELHQTILQESTQESSKRLQFLRSVT